MNEVFELTYQTLVVLGTASLLMILIGSIGLAKGAVQYQRIKERRENAYIEFMNKRNRR
jgi:hypothetical protein